MSLARWLKRWFRGPGRRREVADGAEQGLTEPPGDLDPSPGLVDVFKPELIAGRLYQPRQEAGFVAIEVNGRVVARTTARPPVGAAQVREVPFARRVGHLWKFLGQGDVVEVKYLEQALPIRGHGPRYVDRSGKPSKVGVLFERIDRGYVFTKYGHLKLSISKDPRWQQAVTGLFWELREKLKARFDLDLQVTYGTLLGAIREGDFIGHDNDFDACYLSRFTRAKDVREEFVAVCTFLIEAGYHLKIKRTHLWVMIPGTETKLDIFYAWFNSAGLYRLSNGHHGPSATRSEDFFRFKEVQLGAYTVSVPLAADAILVQFYGPEWRIPDPGFKHESATLKVDKTYHLREEQVTRLYWKQFYRDTPVDGGSSFAASLVTRLRPDTLVVEIGCGRGGDAVYFARHGLKVRAFDRGGEALDEAREAVRKHAVVARCQIFALDVMEVGAVRDALNDPEIVQALQKRRPVVVYVRQLLDRLPVVDRSTFLGTLVNALPEGARLCLEVRTADAVPAEEAAGVQPAQLANGEDIALRLEKTWGMTILERLDAVPLSPIEGDGACVCRIIARRLP